MNYPNLKVVAHDPKDGIIEAVTMHNYGWFSLSRCSMAPEFLSLKIAPKIKHFSTMLLIELNLYMIQVFLYHIWSLSR